MPPPLVIQVVRSHHRQLLPRQHTPHTGAATAAYTTVADIAHMPFPPYFSDSVNALVVPLHHTPHHVPACWVLHLLVGCVTATDFSGRLFPPMVLSPPRFLHRFRLALFPSSPPSLLVGHDNSRPYGVDALPILLTGPADLPHRPGSAARNRAAFDALPTFGPPRACLPPNRFFAYRFICFGGNQGTALTSTARDTPAPSSTALHPRVTPVVLSGGFGVRQQRTGFISGRFPHTLRLRYLRYPIRTVLP